MAAHDPEGVTTASYGSKTSTKCRASTAAASGSPALRAGCPQHDCAAGNATRQPAAAVVLVDRPLGLPGALLGALRGALDARAGGGAGPLGPPPAALCDYEEHTAGDVAAVQGYCLAARRAELVAAGGVQEAFAWYRNADIDVSLRLRTLEEPTRRAVAVGADHCRRHTHRAWEATPAAE